MAKDDIRLVGHMADCARRIQSYLAGKNHADYDVDEILRLAVIHLIQTFGEAARLTWPDFRQQHPEIPWPAIIGMRHRIVHDYLNVDFDIAWEVATKDVPALIADLDPLLPPLP